MAANGDIYLGQSGSEVLLSPFGRKLRIIPREEKREGKTASGKLVWDIIAIKHDFELPYSVIDGDDLDVIIGLFDLNEPLTLLIYDSPSTYFLSATGSAPIVKMDPVPRERLTLIGTGLWVDANLRLTEI